MGEVTSKQAIDAKATATTKARYDRVAPFYDLMGGVMEQLFFHKWRKLVWQAVSSEAKRILEVGVGTGKNFPYYPKGTQITAIDISDRMLTRARRRAEKLSLNIEFEQMDAQALKFPDGSFDVVVSTFVFCSVPDPVLGLQEVKRVLRPDGRAVFLEHMRPESPWVGKLFDLLNPLVVRLWGANINRRTIDNIEKAGLKIQRVEHLTAQGIVRLVIAKAGKEKSVAG